MLDEANRTLEQHDQIDLDVKKPRWAWIMLAFTGGVILLAGLFLAGFLPKSRRTSELGVDVERLKNELVQVEVAHPKRAPARSQLLLPGTVRAALETTINARVNGYLKRWLVDIGDDVANGQVLAEIEVPELDQELDQARAAQNQAIARKNLADANVDLADSTLKRYQAAAPAGGITQQELAEKAAALEVAKCNVAAAKADIAASEANVRRLEQLRSFAQVQAPFAGTITARTVDVGSLIGAGNGRNQALFNIVQANPARVFVSVPQAFAASVTSDAPASVLLTDRHEVRLEGRITRTSRSIDDATRTLLAEVDVPNEKHLLLSGMYVQVQLGVGQDPGTLLVPESAVLTTADGTQVIVVQDERV
ncbi:MAG TPA: efflux RND transporter periplasmic adaptor subunit, partial [Planctomycetota bacterium]|nr:efflux RND transporter periplasmic adaptor subunit [Planctomycetota bacterium]